MKIERPIYMQQLIDSKDNGLIKIVTGLRRVGKINGRLLKPAVVMLIRLHRHTLKERTCNSCLLQKLSP